MNNEFGGEAEMTITNKIILDTEEIYTKEEVEANVNIWLKALDSGEYKQGVSYLVNGDKFCCLGVACDLTDMEYVLKDVGAKEKVREYDGLAGIIPYPAMKAFGLQDNEGQFKSTDPTTDVHPSLAQLNDSGMSFKQIAAVIRSQPEDLFSYSNLKLV